MLFLILFKKRVLKFIKLAISTFGLSFKLSSENFLLFIPSGILIALISAPKVPIPFDNLEELYANTDWEYKIVGTYSTLSVTINVSKLTKKFCNLDEHFRKNYVK